MNTRSIILLHFPTLLPAQSFHLHERLSRCTCGSIHPFHGWMRFFLTSIACVSCWFLDLLRVLSLLDLFPCLRSVHTSCSSGASKDVLPHSCFCTGVGLGGVCWVEGHRPTCISAVRSILFARLPLRCSRLGSRTASQHAPATSSRFAHILVRGPCSSCCGARGWFGHESTHALPLFPNCPMTDPLSRTRGKGSLNQLEGRRNPSDAKGCEYSRPLETWRGPVGSFTSDHKSSTRGGVVDVKKDMGKRHILACC